MVTPEQFRKVNGFGTQVGMGHTLCHLERQSKQLSPTGTACGCRSTGGGAGKMTTSGSAARKQVREQTTVGPACASAAPALPLELNAAPSVGPNASVRPASRPASVWSGSSPVCPALQGCGRPSTPRCNAGIRRATTSPTSTTRRPRSCGVTCVGAAWGGLPHGLPGQCRGPCRGAPR